MASTYDFNITQGSTASFNITLNDADETPMDFTGYSIRGSIKLRYSDTSPLVNFSPSVSGNVITIDLTSAQTMFLPVGVAVYDIERYTNSYDSEVLLAGKVYMFPEVTTT
jgi:hypothetical protein